MSDGKFGSWFRTNLIAIMVPTISVGAALIVSYGSSIQTETDLFNRIKLIEQQIIALDTQDEEFDDDFDEFEDEVQEKIRSLQNMIIREGRDLERAMIRIESRLDSLNRRMTLFDGIGSPSTGIWMLPQENNSDSFNMPQESIE